jgi:hypothetical protein
MEDAAMEDYVSWVAAEALAPGRVSGTTPRGLFILTEIASSPVWVTGHGCAVRLDEHEKYLAWDVSEDEQGYSGVHVGEVRLVIDPLALASGSGREIGDLLIRDGSIFLVSASGEPHAPQRLIQVGASAGEKVPHAVRCTKWALLLADYEGEEWPVFQHGVVDDA